MWLTMQQLPFTIACRSPHVFCGTQARRFLGSGACPAGQQTPVEVTCSGAQQTLPATGTNPGRQHCPIPGPSPPGEVVPPGTETSQTLLLTPLGDCPLGQQTPVVVSCDLRQQELPEGT